MTRRRIVVAAALVVGVWLGACAFLLGKSALDLQAGRSAAREGRDDLDATTVADGSVLEPLEEARDRFSSAHSATGSPVLAPLRALPIVGRQVRSVHALSGAAGEVASAGVLAVDRAQEVLDEPAGGGPARVDQIRVIAETVRDAADRVASIDDLGPREALIGPLADARNELAADLVEARSLLADAGAGADAAVSLLEGPRRYLLVAANNAEMRSGSGMWLSGGILTTAAGRIELGDVSPLYLDADPPDGAVTLDDADVEARWGWMNPQREWRSLMASPRFPASADLATRMWEAAGQPAVDGVLVVDPIALKAVVAATRPVEIDGEPLETDRVPAVLLHDQYWTFDTSGEQAARREMLGTVAKAAFTALDEGDWSPAVLVEQLGAAIRGRHLLAWSSDEVEQAGWEAAGMDGHLTGRSLLVSVLNRGGNKLDWFLDVASTLSTTEADDGGTEVTVEVELHNTTPDGERSYVAGPHPDLAGELSYGDYKGVVAVHVPRAATELVIDGAPAVHVSGSDGPTRVIGSQIVLPQGERTTLTVRFLLPAEVGRLRVEPSARFPATEWRWDGEEWKDDQPRTIWL